VPIAGATLTVRLQLCPPRVIAKVAVPVAEGVPVIVYDTEPLPFNNVPALKVTVNPVTPVDDIACPLYVPPFPPV
jgi:hypothetical protein